MNLPTIPLANLLLGFGPILLLLFVMHRWSLKALDGLYANARMLVQLLLVGYVLTFIFETEEPIVIACVIVVMLVASAWIALRPLQVSTARLYLVALVSISVCGLAVLVLVTQIILEMPRWFEPRIVVPLGGMVFANAMNTVSLAAARLESEIARDTRHLEARKIALDVALIPQVNSLLAVGLVSLPGMMTGQILTGVDPLVAARYQIMVMCMIFGSAGLAAALYLRLCGSGAGGTSRSA